MQIQFTVPNLSNIVALYKDAPNVVLPILQKYLQASGEVLAKYRSGNVPYAPFDGGGLITSFVKTPLGALSYSYGPTKKYAGYVEFGTGPHIIRAIPPKKGLANKYAGQYFGPIVHHPGTKPNPYMEKILAAATPELTELFQQAETDIVAAMNTA